jgi:hypothetical protein
MNKILISIYFVSIIVIRIGAQNWVPVPCFNVSRSYAAIDPIFVDSLHDELILNSAHSYSSCSVYYKGVLAYNGVNFHDLDIGVETHASGLSEGGPRPLECIQYKGKTLFGGKFSSVGSKKLPAKALALWDGSKWDSLRYTYQNYQAGAVGSDAIVNGFHRHNGKLWIYGQFIDLGGVAGKHLYTYDGNVFTSYTIPVTTFDGVKKLVSYKNKLIATGDFYNNPSFTIFRLAQYNGNTWSSVGNGVQGGVGGVADMLVYKDTLYIAGSFSKWDGNKGNYVMKWDGTQLLDAGFSCDFRGWWVVYKLIEYRDKLYAFGNFTDSLCGQKAYSVAYYEKGKWTFPKDSFGHIIYSAAVYHDELYVSGAFKDINGVSVPCLAKLRCPNFDAATGCISSLSNEAIEAKKIQIFPNPTNGIITTNLEGEKIITNYLGQVLLTSPEKEINISHLPNGVYLIRCGNRFGKVLKE